MGAQINASMRSAGRASQRRYQAPRRLVATGKRPKRSPWGRALAGRDSSPSRPTASRGAAQAGYTGTRWCRHLYRDRAAPTRGTRLSAVKDAAGSPRRSAEAAPRRGPGQLASRPEHSADKALRVVSRDDEGQIEHRTASANDRLARSQRLRTDGHPLTSYPLAEGSGLLGCIASAPERPRRL